MTLSRKRRISSTVWLLGVGVLVVAGMALYPSLRERYWLWRLESGTEDERQTAADRLAELKVGEAVPILIRSIPRERRRVDLSRDLFEPAPHWMRAMIQLGELSVPKLGEVLGDRDAAPRTYAAFILGEIGPSAMDAVPALLAAVRAAREDLHYTSGDPEVFFVIVAGLAVSKISPDAMRENSELFDFEMILK